MPESSKPIPEVGYPIQIMKKNHEQTLEVLEDRHKNLMGALGKVRFVEHPKLGVPFTGGNKDTPDIGSNDAKGSNKAENIEASSKGKGVAGEKSGSKEVTGDTTEQLKAAQVTANRPQIPRMYPYDPKDHGVATRLQYHPRAPAMNAYDPKDHGAATRLQYIMYGETKKL